MSDLLDAFRQGAAKEEIDDVTIAFLLETLEHATAEEWEPILEPFVSDPTAILQVLSANSNAAAEAQEILLLDRQRRPETVDLPTQIDPEEAAASDLQYCNSYTCIPGAHNRAISLQQLRQILAYIKSKATPDGKLPWFDQDDQSPTYGMQLTVQNMNLYHVVDFVIKPLTFQHQCSMVEILATEPQRPLWFVSHAWREPVSEMVAALTEHANVRGLDSDKTLYWVCGYANNQHNLSQDIRTNPRETSFYRALRQCEGMLLCLDSLGTPFQRIWCCFEQAMIVQEEQQKLLLDIATVVDGTPVVITDGRAAPVAADLREGPKFALEFKRDRESGFPLDLLERGYEIDICAAQAAKEDDRRRILNTIQSMSSRAVSSEAGDDATTDERELVECQEPNLADPVFTSVNKVLRGIFAEAAARKAAEAGRIDTVIRVLQEDIDRTKLTLNLGGCTYLDLTALSNLKGHSSLQQLTVDCSYSGVTNVPRLGDALSGLHHLQKLHLNFQWSASLSEQEIVQLSERGLASLWATLTELRLDFTGCSFAVFLPKIEVLQSLETLFINYSYTPTAAIAKTLLGILQLRLLRELDLRFRACQHVKHLKPLRKLVQLAHLETLTLNFDYTYLSDVEGLDSLLEMKDLAQCSLSFTKCTQITNIPWLTELVYQQGLQLAIDLSECKELEPNLRAYFGSRQDLLQALAGGTARSQPSTTIFSVGEEIEYYSRAKRSWLPAVVHILNPEAIDVRIRGHQETFPRKVLLSEIPIKIRRKNSPEVNLTEQFRVGEVVEYFARDWNRIWLPAVVNKVEADALRVDVTGYDYPRRIGVTDIPIQIRKMEQKNDPKASLPSESLDKSGSTANLMRQYQVGESVEYLKQEEPGKGWCPAIVHKIDSRGIRVRTVGNREPQRVLNRDLTNHVRPMQTRKGQREPQLAPELQPIEDSLDAGKHIDKSRLLGQFRVSESVEYFSQYHKVGWMPAVVQKIDANALRVNVAGYHDTRRVLAADIPTKIRKLEKPER